MEDALKDVMTVKQVTERAGVTKQHVCQLCREGRLDAVKVGRDWLISRRSALQWIYSDRKKGRPKKDEGRL